MSSNLPDGVNEYTPEAPWNEKTKEVLITVILTLSTEVSEDFSDDDIRSEAHDEISRALVDSDFEIEEIIVESF